jgi:hypothetical protein
MRINTQGEVKMRLKIALTLAFLLVSATVVLAQTQSTGAENEHQGVVNTIHDINAVSGEACLNCHSTHAARGDTDTALLWARALTETTFNTYDSASLTVDGNKDLAVSGAAVEEWGSLICLSCHDDGGVADDANIAVGGNRGNPAAAATKTFTGITSAQLASTSVFPVRNNALPTTLPIGTSGVTTFAGTQLKTDHPVNVEFSATNPLLETRTAAETDGVKFYDDSAGKPTVQCGSCHNPHEQNFLKTVGPGADWGNRTYFIRGRLSRGQDLCLACHL